MRQLQQQQQQPLQLQSLYKPPASRTLMSSTYSSTSTPAEVGTQAGEQGRWARKVGKGCGNARRSSTGMSKHGVLLEKQAVVGSVGPRRSIQPGGTVPAAAQHGAEAL